MGQTTLIRALQDPTLYNHPVEQFEVIETHISWVILAGDYAYKIKKAVNLGFLDFSTLEQRHHYCLEELRLNKRTSDDIYLSVIPIRGSSKHPHLSGNEAIIEYAVKMRRFSTSSIVTLIEKNEIGEDEFVKLGGELALFHQAASSATENDTYGNPDIILAPVKENFSQLSSIVKAPQIKERIRVVESWSYQQHERLKAVMQQRKSSGKIKECHGDMHLGNLFYHNHQLTLFDCLEFDPALRWIDSISDLAFLLMDLHLHGQKETANRVLNEYLTYSGDYQGLALLPYYLVYRAMVRCKISAIEYANGLESEKNLDLLQQYVSLAESYCKPHHPSLIITFGFSASGKSTVARLVAQHIEGIHIRSDVERKRLNDLSPMQRSGSETNSGIYNDSATEATYQALATLSGTIINAGYSVIVDATFLRKDHREQFQQLAHELQVSYCILNCFARIEILEDWIKERIEKGNDPSEATIDVLHHQLTNHDPLSGDEKKATFNIDTEKTIDAAIIAKQIEERSLPNLLCDPG